MKTLIKRRIKHFPVTQEEASIPVLHIIKSLGRGGAETLLPETLHKHDKTKYQFHYIYFLPWKDQMVEQIKEEGGTVVCMAAKNNIEILLTARKIMAYVKEHKIQLIHCHLPWAGIVGRLVGKIRKVPVIYTEHNTWEHYHKLTYHLNKLSFSSQHKVIAVSKDVENSIKANYGKSYPKVEVVLNGINTEKFSNSISVKRNIRKELNISHDAIVIGIVCVFRAQKRLNIWLEIAQQLLRNHPQCTFIIVGDGPLKDDLHQKARELQMEGHVHFAGLQSEIRPYLKAFNVFMMSSEFEGLPIALLEAMSMGCMPVCTDAGGIPELITDGKNGLLAPTTEPMLLIQKLDSYLENPADIRQLGEAARETVVKRFSLQKMVNELENIYENALNNQS
ncbi:MAG: glycosyltransferase [Chitinophagaceae bacterium]|nr:glycosyltransferase [Chitinophagaceae bacterium]